MRQFQSVPTTYVTEIKETYLELYISRIMFISFAPLKHLNLSIKIKIPVTIWQIVYIYMRAFSPNLISLNMLLLSWYLCGCNRVENHIVFVMIL